MLRDLSSKKIAVGGRPGRILLVDPDGIEQDQDQDAQGEPPQRDQPQTPGARAAGKPLSQGEQASQSQHQHQVESKIKQGRPGHLSILSQAAANCPMSCT